MSTSDAIAATTLALQSLIMKWCSDPLSPLQSGFAGTSAIGDLTVTTAPPDKARAPAEGKNQLNLFLYQTSVNAGWSNLVPPQPGKGLGSGRPPLAMNLRYLVTAYGQADDDHHYASHRILGAAMLALHENAIMDRQAIADAGAGQQIENLRIAPLNLSIDELSKLWMIYQSPYRISAAYEVTVVLLDTDQGAAPLPVLKRGGDDRGPTVASAFPITLTAIRYEGGRAAARLGESVILEGEGLVAEGWRARVFCQRRHLEAFLALKEGGKPGTLKVELPADTRFQSGSTAGWIPGVFTLSLEPAAKHSAELPSNDLALLIATSFTLTPEGTGPLKVQQNGTFEFTPSPALADEQVPEVLLGGTSRLSVTKLDGGKLNCMVPDDTPEGEYPIRLRVDGVDSIPSKKPDHAGAKPEFDLAQIVKVVP